MPTSVNTNLSALIAARVLGGAQDALDRVQKKVSTGYKVADAFDNGALFAIAQNVRNDVAALGAVNTQLGGAQGLLSVANAGGTEISNKMEKLRETLVGLSNQSYSQNSETRNQLTDQYRQLVSSIQNYIQSSDYNGTNLLNTSGAINVLQDVLGQTQLTITGQATTFISLISNLSVASAISLTNAATFAAGTFASMLANVNSALNTIGALNTRLNDQIRFNNSVSDAYKAGLSSLIDADLSIESANLTSLQIKQQLATQSLSIANQRPQVLLSLFG